MRSRRLAFLLYSLPVILAALASGALRAEPFFAPEASPDEVAEAWARAFPGTGEFSEDPGARAIPARDFDRYAIVVDVFRRSRKRPVLGLFTDAYVDLLAPAAEWTTGSDDVAKRTVLAKKRFARLADVEFAVVTVDGVPRKVNLISGAIESVVDQAVKDADGVPMVRLVTDPKTGKTRKVFVTKKSRKTTPPGNYKLTPVLMRKKTVRADGTRATESVPYPFLTSETYDASPMFWGLHLFGGYFMHSSPHYDHLGRPASMGCIRQSFPDAMELFDLVTNQAEGRLAMVRVHAMHSAESYTRLRELFYDPTYVPTAENAANAAGPEAARDFAWLLTALGENASRISDFVKFVAPEYEGRGHGWYDPATRTYGPVTYPTCGARDCFETWGDPMEMLREKRRKVVEMRRRGEARAAARAAAENADSGESFAPLN